MGLLVWDLYRYEKFESKGISRERVLLIGYMDGQVCLLWFTSCAPCLVCSVCIHTPYADACTHTFADTYADDRTLTRVAVTHRTGI